MKESGKEFQLIMSSCSYYKGETFVIGLIQISISMIMIGITFGVCE